MFPRAEDCRTFHTAVTGAPKHKFAPWSYITWTCQVCVVKGGEKASTGPAAHEERHLFSCSVVSDSLRPHGLQQARLPWLHYLLEFAQTHVHWVSDAIQPSHPLSPFSSCLQSFPASGSFPVSQFFASGRKVVFTHIPELLVSNNPYIHPATDISNTVKT